MFAFWFVVVLQSEEGLLHGFSGSSYFSRLRVFSCSRSGRVCPGFSYFGPVPSACRSCMVSWIMVAAAAFVFAVTLRPGVHGHGPLEFSKRP